MNSQQKKLSGFTATNPDGSKEVWDFTTTPWKVSEYDASGNLIDSYHVTKPTKNTPSQRID